MFKDYRVNPSYGDGTAGVYHRFQSGFMDVFMLDTRYFAGLEKNPDAEDAPSALGAAQWKWLTRASNPPPIPSRSLSPRHDLARLGGREEGRLLGALRRPKREALLRLHRRQQDQGCDRGGWRYPRERGGRDAHPSITGYPIVAWTVSPLNDKVIKGNHLPREGLVYRLQEPNVMLLLNCGPGDENEPAITGNFINGAGKRLRTSTSARPPPAAGTDPAWPCASRTCRTERSR